MIQPRLNPCHSVLRFITDDEKLLFSGHLHYEHERNSVFQIQTRLQNLSNNLQNKSNDIEVLAVDLPKETLINFLSLEFDAEEQFNISVKTLLSRLPKQRYLKYICEQIHHFKISKRVAAVVLYSYRRAIYSFTSSAVFYGGFDAKVILLTIPVKSHD